MIFQIKYLQKSKKYSQNEENAILRKKLAGLDNGEFEAYNTYVEDCKSKIKEMLK